MDLPATGNKTVDSVVALIGAAYMFLSLLALVLPKRWRVTRALGRWVADVRGVVHHKEPEAAPEAEKR